MPQFTVESRAADGRLTVSVIGELDLATAPELRAALDAAEAADVAVIELDLSELTFIDSTGVAVLVEYTARSRSDSDRLRIRTGAAVDHVLRISGASSHLPLMD